MSSSRAPRRTLRRNVLVAGALLAACSTTGEPSQSAATAVRPVTASGLTQTVVPAVDGFDRVTVHTATYGELDGVDGILVLEVRQGSEVRATAADGADLVDNHPVTLTFEALPDSGGEVAELTFRYEGTEPLALYIDPYDAYAAGSLIPGPGDLTFTLGHDDRLGGAIDAGGRVVREAGDKATSDLPFLLVWVASLVAAGVVLRRNHPAG